MFPCWDSQRCIRVSLIHLQQFPKNIEYYPDRLTITNIGNQAINIC